MIEKANKILAKYEDDNEYHLHECDRKWIVKAMIELAESEVEKLTIHDVSKSVCYKGYRTRKNWCQKCEYYEICNFSKTV